MIKLDIKPYCENCENFEADVEKFYAGHGVILTHIQCSHANQCREIKNYLENYKERSNESTN